MTALQRRQRTSSRSISTASTVRTSGVDRLIAVAMANGNVEQRHQVDDGGRRLEHAAQQHVGIGRHRDLPPGAARQQGERAPQGGEEAAHADRLDRRHRLGCKLDQRIVEDEDHDRRRHREDAAGVVDHLVSDIFRMSFQCSSLTGTTESRDWRTSLKSLNLGSALMAAKVTGCLTG